MGCDGGTIPTRDELVRTRKKPEQKDKKSERQFKWRYCHLTQERLNSSNHVVACQLGRLYNKSTLIEALLESKKKNGHSQSSVISHIKSLKDVKDLQLTANPAFRSTSSSHSSRSDETATSGGDGGEDGGEQPSPWICPITSHEMNGKHKFILDWSDGRVISERAQNMLKSASSKSVNSQSKRCSETPSEYIEDVNLVILNPDPDELEIMKVRMENRKLAAAAKKRKNKSSKSADSGREDSQDASSSLKKSKSSESDEVISKNDEMEKKKKKIDLQSDTSKSEVFKSLFSSHKSAQNKTTAHWVTFDPRYN